MKFYLGLVLLLGLSSAGFSKTIYFGAKTENIQIPYMGKYLFRFPSEVSKVLGARKFKIKPADNDQPNYAVLTVEPRLSQGSNKVTFVLSDGRIITTKLSVSVSTENLDEVIDFRSDEDAPSVEVEGSTSSPSELELLKAMIRGEKASGYSVKDQSIEVKPGFKGLGTRLVRTYRGGIFVGYIFELTNTSRNQTLSINIKNLSLGDPNVAILGNVSPETIEPKGTVILRIVAKAKTAYSQLILPVEAVEKR